MTLRPISSLVQYGISLRRLQRWCKEGRITAELRNGEWWVNLEDMARRLGLDSLADEIADSEKDIK